jgi:hypothetical protein
MKCSLEALSGGGRERRADAAAEATYVAAIRDTGATWWHEFLPPATPEAEAIALIERGPLRLAATGPSRS